ncbi:hypothetical protein GE09DRAFT_1176725 [Coniochaeta sp. 2T2.1]|nr:hypothetical protein GE09DRAFT_1176725 [Coniochaeta sp. 2T2.1]
MSTVGLMPPPEGVIPDSTRKTDLQHTLIVVFTVTFGIATLTLALRLYTRAWIVKNAGLDEPIIFLAWAASLAFFKTSVKAMPAGFGRHMWDVTPTQLPAYLDVTAPCPSPDLHMAPTLTKLAILVLYWRINPTRFFRTCVLGTTAMLLAYTITFTALLAGPCNPLATGSGVCLNNIAIAQAVLNIITDGIIIALPIPTIHRLNMPLKQKIQVGIILALASAACIASIVRVSYVKAMQNNPDVTWTQASAAVWSCLELNLGILCNYLALLKPFVRVHMPFLAGSGSGPTRGGGGEDSGASELSLSKRINKPWDRMAGGKHSYQLHSIGKASAEPSNTQAGWKGVVVVDEFKVDIEYPRRKDDASGDGESTDSILRPCRPAHRRM